MTGKLGKGRPALEADKAVEEPGGGAVAAIEQVLQKR